ncbi:MAG: GAF domain-containing sensor histidine kinase [Acidimicrobiia bacterium]|jgi:signal transduction histidine kinase
MVDAPRLTRLTPLIEEAASVGGGDELGKLLRSLVVEARSATGARYCALGVVGDHGVLSEFIYDGIDPEEATKIGDPPIGRGVLGTLIRSREPLVLDEISEHPDSVGFPDNHPAMHGFLGVPVAVGGESFGNLYLTEKEGGFTEDDVVAVEALSHIAGVAIQNARMHARLQRVAIVEDRQRIARDLHDSVIQDLFAVGLGLQSMITSIDDDRLSERLNEAIDTLDSSVAALRRYIFELKDSRPPATDLDQRLQDVVSRMGSVYPAHVELEIDGIVEGPWVDDVVLLVTEALSNALRHSGSDEIHVLVTRDEGHLVIEVSDRGSGFRSTDVGRGLGLASMRARAELHGGSAEVRSEPGEGTLVSVRLPIEP